MRRGAPRQARSRKAKPTAITKEPPKVEHNAKGVPGLIYIPNFLSETEHDSILSILYGVQNDLWVYEDVKEGVQLRRRNQQFGWKYSYALQDIEKVEDLPLPEWVDIYVKRLMGYNIIKDTPVQMIVNEYTAGQGITPHIDKVHCFGDFIIGINLLSGLVMDFTEIGNKKNSIEVYLEPRSAYIMTGPARYEYKHSIDARSTDIVNQRTIKRGKRVSLTLRTIIPH